MNICFLCNEYPPASHGGIGRATRTLAQSLVQAGHQARVVGFTFRAEPVAESENDGGVQVQRFRFKKSAALGWVRARARLFRTVSRWAQAGEIDLVEAPDYEGLVAGWLSLPIPVVVRLHGSSSYFAVEMGGRPDWKTRMLERASLRRADFRCSCSRYTAEKTQSLFKLAGPQAAVLYNSVPIPASLPPAPRAANKVVFTGTLTPKKGIVALVQAWPLVQERFAQAELHVFGKDGRTSSGESMQQYLRSLLPARVLASVYFHGHVGVEQLRAAFETARAAVFPSYSEAFALAPMEAMAEGCPTIYSRRSSCRELIDDGENGLLIDPDQPQEIAAAIGSLLGDEALADRLGRAGRKTIEERFSPSGLLGRNIDFYSQCVESFRGHVMKDARDSYAVAERVAK